MGRPKDDPLSKKVKKRHLLDYSILIPYLILTVIGLMMVYSASSYSLISQGKNPITDMVKQAIFLFLSIILMAILYKMKLSMLKNLKFVRIFVAIVLGLMVIAFGFKTVNGAHGWIQIPGLGTIQPVEFWKFVMIWMLAAQISDRQVLIPDKMIEAVKVPVGLCALSMGILALYPDFGNAAIIALLLIVMLMISGINYLYGYIIAFGTFAFSILTMFIIRITNGSFLPAHVASRFAVFLNPFKDEFGDGHQLVNGYYAMFNGRLFGLGLGNSIQKKGFLSFAASTDFIFAIVVEELGLIGAICILGLLLFLVGRILLIGIRSNDAFNSMICLGVGSLFLIQIFINLGGITGLIPLTGITFPFFSQGGSSLIVLSACVGLVLNISADEKKKKLMLY
ncbi:MAG: cell division protein FtsW [Enterococcus sp.]|nr:cell division protein FtsW [Enterococcus sp.]